MLSIYEIEKVEIAKKLLQEVEAQLKADEISKSILLGDAINACDEVLQEDLPEGYTPPNKEDWYSPGSIEKLLPAPTMGDRIVEALSRVAGSTIICAGLSACLSLGCWGVSEFKAASNDYHQPNFAAQSRSYLGLTAIFGSITSGCIVLIAVADRGVK